MSKVSSESGSKPEVKVDKEARKRIKDSIAECNDKFGDNAVMQLGETPIRKVDSISTGSLTIDSVLGSGGIPRGVIVEIYGPEGGGKSTLCLQTLAELNRMGGNALYIDSENKLNLQYAKDLGVNTKDLLLAQPDYGEAAFQIIEIFVKNKAVELVIIDSIAMLVPKAEFEGEIGDSGVALLSRMVTQAIRKLKDHVRRENVAVMAINQIREKIGAPAYANETTPAGRALKHAATIRMDIRRIAALKDGDKVVGARTKLKVTKNTYAAPFQDCEYDLRYGEGICRESELIDIGIEKEVLKKSGASIYIGDEKLGHGREATRIRLKQHPELFLQIRDLVKVKLSSGGPK